MSRDTAASTGPARIDALDFVKGVLVVFMVVYHALNYSEWRRVPGLYLSFLPPSFILLAGFLLTSVYTGKYRNSGWALDRRLLIRGLKLVAIFTVLNLGGNLVFDRNYSGQALGLGGFLSEARDTFLFGNTRTASFEILVPIGYLLMAAPLFLRLHFANAYAVFTVAAAMFAACVWLEHRGLPWSIGQLFTVGVIGLAAGQVALPRWDGIARHWPVVLLGYGLHWACHWWLGQVYLVQAFAACTSVLLLYALAIRVDGAWPLVGQVNCLGRYSLFSYIVQIAVLQVIHRSALFDGSSPVQVVGMGGVTLAVTWGAVCVVEVMRKRSTGIDRLYRFVFA